MKYLQMETCGAPAGKRLRQLARTLFVMLREGLAFRGLFSNLRLDFLLRQGKIAGRALVLSNLLSSIHGSAVDAFSCRFMDPDAATFAPREVEFSCSSTPEYASGRRRRRRRYYNGYDAAVAVARAFEILDSEMDNRGSLELDEMPTPLLSVLGTPAASVRPLRVTDSPFSVKEDGDTNEVVDVEAEKFITRFYEQLRQQQMWSI